MSKSKKGGLLGRQRAALSRLEIKYNEFKKAGNDKQPWDTALNSRHPKHHAGHTFVEECKRMETEIQVLKDRINGAH